MMCLLADNLALSAADTLLMVVPACHANACATPSSVAARLMRGHACFAVLGVALQRCRQDQHSIKHHSVTSLATRVPRCEYMSVPTYRRLFGLLQGA